jgi:hypothetical protein
MYAELEGFGKSSLGVYQYSAVTQLQPTTKLLDPGEGLKRVTSELKFLPLEQGQHVETCSGAQPVSFPTDTIRVRGGGEGGVGYFPPFN